MKKTNKALALLLSALMAATAFCSVPLSASAEENKGVENQTVVAEVPTESETEGASESTTENIEEVSSEPVVNTGYSRAEKTVQNESAVANNMVESSASVESVEISSSITLGVSETYTFSKTSLQKALSTNSSATYKWSSSNSNIVSVNSSGKITAKKVGETTINVVASNGKKGFCKVVVKNAPARIYLNKIGVTLGAGETFDLSASLPSGTASYSIKFSSNNTSVATVNSTSGLITAKKVGTAVITATTYNGKTATCTVTVKNAPDKITLNKTAITLGVGETFRISLSLPSGTAAYNIKVGSNNPSVAVFNTSSGQITAKKVGTAVITFTAYNGKKASCTVTVKNAPDKITLNKTAVTLGVGETFDLNATLPSGTASYSIKFSSGSTSVATVNSTSGLITAKKVGTAVITATTYNNKKADCTVTVKNAPGKITLNKTAITLGVGETFDLNATLPSGTASYSIKFSSGSTSVATVNSASGLITAKKVGTAVITATTYNNKKADCTVTVKNAPSKITLNKTTLTLGVGETFDLNASLPSGTASYSIKYTSNNTGVATVNSSGGLVTAKKVGTAVITATTYNDKTATCTVTVKKDDTEEYINEVLRLTNEERKKEGLPALAKRTDVDKVAAIRAEEISVKFSHTRPNGKNCFSLISEYGISYSTLGENIAAGQKTPKEVVNAWMNSEGHRKNILNPKFKGLGVGYYVEGNTAYWVQMMIG